MESWLLSSNFAFLTTSCDWQNVVLFLRFICKYVQVSVETDFGLNSEVIFRWGCTVHFCNSVMRFEISRAAGQAKWSADVINPFSRSVEM